MWYSSLKTTMSASNQPETEHLPHLLAAMGPNLPNWGSCEQSRDTRATAHIAAAVDP